MKKLIKFVIFLVIAAVIISGAVYLDYYNTKANNTSPKISIKEESDDYILYKSILYRVLYCKTNKRYIIGSYSEDVVCPKNYDYVDDSYTNEEGIKISKRDLQLLANDGVYTSEMIENMNSNKQVEAAVHVAYNFGKTKYSVIKSEKNYKLVVFPEFKEEDGTYKWVYDEEDKENYYCLTANKYDISYAKYSNGSCGKYEKLKMDEEWCSTYENSTLVYEDGIGTLCEE